MLTVSATPLTTHVKKTSTWMELLMARPTLGPPRVSDSATEKRQVATTRMAPKKSHLPGDTWGFGGDAMSGVGEADVHYLRY